MTIRNDQNKESFIVNNNESNMTLKEKWHRILGHINFNYLNSL